MDSVIEQQAQAAYDAFAKHRRGYRGMPPWELALERERYAWRSVARAVMGVRTLSATSPSAMPKRAAFGR